MMPVMKGRRGNNRPTGVWKQTALRLPPPQRVPAPLATALRQPLGT